MTWRSMVAWAAATVVVCVAAGAWQRPLTGDNQLYFYIAERAASGVPPHVSVVDSKSQLSSLLGAGAIVAGRRIGLDDVRATRALSIALAAVAVALTAQLGAVVAGSAAAGHLAALALLAERGFFDHAAIGSNPKIFLVTFVVAAHLLCARRRWTAAGLAAGAAFLCWQPALAVVAAVGVEALLAARGGRAAAARVAVAALACVLAYEIYYAAFGVMMEQLDQSYVMTLGSLHRLPRLGPALWFVLSEAGRRHGSVCVPPAAWFASLAALAGALAVGSSSTLRSLAQRPGAISVVLASLVAVAFTLYDHQGLSDLLWPAPYFALATGWSAVVAAGLATRVGAHRGVRRTTSMLVVGTVALLLVTQCVRTRAGAADRGDQRARAGRGGRVSADRSRTLDSQYELGAVVREYLDGDRGVWAYRCVHVLGFAHADNWVPYATLYDDVATRFALGRFRPLRDGRMPEVILRGGGRLPGGRRYLRREYRGVAAPLFAREGLRVYVRRPSFTASAPGR